MSDKIILWIAFNIFLVLMLVLDLKVFHRKPHEISLKEALIWSFVWIALAFIFAGGVFVWMDHERALSFITGYLIEKSLSVDNLFVFLMIFTYFKTPARYQHRVLFWGIFGALILRFIFIFAGVALIERFHWTIYILGVLLIFTGIKMLKKKEGDVQLENNLILKLLKRFVPVTTEYENEKFFVRKDGMFYATPLFIVLLVIETSDVMFAIDSVPAVLSITLDPFIVYSSNAFAILGLRALYFALESSMRLFYYLNYGLSLILVFVGVKMLISQFYKFPVAIVLLIIFLVLSVSVVASVMRNNHAEVESHS